MHRIPKNVDTPISVLCYHDRTKYYESFSLVHSKLLYTSSTSPKIFTYMSPDEPVDTFRINFN